MSSTVTLSVGSLVAFRTPAFSTSGVVHEFTVKLVHGTHTFTSPEFYLGIAHIAGSRRVIGQLTFRYSYSAKHGSVTICGTDFPSADGMALVTKAEGVDAETCVEHAASGTGFAADEGLLNKTWNYRTRLMPGAAKAIKDTVRNANDALIASLVASRKVRIVKVRKTVPESLSDDVYHSLCAVYRRGKFLEPHHPNRKYLDHDEVRPLDSTLAGEMIWDQGAFFANVIGSTDDPRPKRKGVDSWLKLWEAVIGGGVPAATCTSYNWASEEPWVCTNNLVGGHVVEGTRAKTVAPGTNGEVAIFPICQKHNRNNSVYMAANKYYIGLLLDNYNVKGE